MRLPLLFVRLSFAALASALAGSPLAAQVAQSAGIRTTPRLTAVAKALGSAVCPGKPPTGAAALLAGGPPGAATLDAVLSRVAQRTAARETSKGRATLTTAASRARSMDDLTLAGGAMYLWGATNGAAHMFALAAKKSADAVALSNLGAALNTLGDFGDAIVVLRAALARTPDFVPAMAGLADARANLGDLPGAEQLLRKATVAAPQFTTARFSLGRVYLCEGKRQPAISAMRAAVIASPGDVAANFVDAVAAAIAPAGQPVPPSIVNAIGVRPTDPGHTFRHVQLEGSLGRPVSAATVSDYAATLMAQSYRARIAAYPPLMQEFGDVASRYEDEAGPDPDGLFPTVEGNHVIYRINDALINKAIQQAEDTLATLTARASDAFYDDRKSKLETPWSDALAHAESMAKRGAVPCSYLGQKGSDLYTTFQRTYGAEFASINAATQDYATRMVNLIGRLHDPNVAAQRLAEAVANIIEYQMQVDTDWGTFIEFSKGCQPQSGRASASDAPGRKRKPVPEPCEQFVNTNFGGLLDLKITCHTLEIGGGELAMASLKLDSRTKEAEIFVGAGLGAKVAGAGVGGKIGVSVKLSGGTVSDAGFTSGAEAGWSKEHTSELTTTMWVSKGVEFSNDYASAFGPLSNASRP